PSQKTDDERPENPYKNNNQGPKAQGNITIEQDVHMVEIDPAPDTEKGQPNINEENMTGKKDVQMSESVVIPETEKIQLNPNDNKRVSPISTGLVTGTIETGTTGETAQPIADEGFTEETPKRTLWKLNPRMLNNTFISKELEADLKDKKATSDWDYYKRRPQPISKNYLSQTA
ncbi:42943_t:CDS:2, partial [Gigaspora margarita]